MQSRKQLTSFRKKASRKVRVAKTSQTNKEFSKIVPALADNGIVKMQTNLALGGEFAAAEIMSGLGYEIIDRPKNYSYCTDPTNSENKKILTNKNILTNELVNQENEKIDVSEYLSDTQNSIFAPDIEKRENQQRTINNSTEKPNINIKVDLTEVVVGMADLFSPDRNGGIILDTDFVKLK